jgi:hypothetical protein
MNKVLFNGAVWSGTRNITGSDCSPPANTWVNAFSGNQFFGNDWLTESGVWAKEWSILQCPNPDVRLFLETGKRWVLAATLSGRIMWSGEKLVGQNPEGVYVKISGEFNDCRMMISSGNPSAFPLFPPPPVVVGLSEGEMTRNNCCLQLGSSGPFTPSSGGKLSLLFNDFNYLDNPANSESSYYVKISGSGDAFETNYVVPCYTSSTIDAFGNAVRYPYTGTTCGNVTSGKKYYYTSSGWGISIEYWSWYMYDVAGISWVYTGVYGGGDADGYRCWRTLDLSGCWNGLVYNYLPGGLNNDFCPNEKPWSLVGRITPTGTGVGGVLTTQKCYKCLQDHTETPTGLWIVDGTGVLASFYGWSGLACCSTNLYDICWNGQKMDWEGNFIKTGHIYIPNITDATKSYKIQTNGICYSSTAYVYLSLPFDDSYGAPFIFSGLTGYTKTSIYWDEVYCDWVLKINTVVNPLPRDTSDTCFEYNTVAARNIETYDYNGLTIVTGQYILWYGVHRDYSPIGVYERLKGCVLSPTAIYVTGI